MYTDILLYLNTLLFFLIPGVCIDLVNGWKCNCPRGYFDSRCLSDVDECASNPCMHGSCEDAVNNYICHCFDGYGGKRCDVEM